MPPAPQQSLWREARAADGKVYYFNVITKETTWVPPEGFAAPSASATLALLLPPLPPGWTETRTPDGTLYYVNAELRQSTYTRPQIGAPVVLAGEAAPAAPPQPKKKPVPLYRTPITGTEWVVVRTDDDKTFFFHSKTKKSFWNTPDELKGVAIPEPRPEDRIEPKKAEEPVIEKRVADDNEDPIAKRLRLGGASPTLEEMQYATGILKPVPVKEQPISDAMPEDALFLDPHERLLIFIEMLRDKKISAFSSWENELPKLQADSRFTFLPPKERRPVFDDFLRSKVEEEKVERRQKLAKTKELFMNMLAEVKLTKTSTFSEFAEKCKHDYRYKAIEKMIEREQLFKEHMANVRKGIVAVVTKQPETAKEAYLSLLKEQKLEKGSSWRKTKEIIQTDPRYQAVEKDSEREKVFRDFVVALGKSKEDAIKQREEEVRRERQEVLKDMDYGLEQLRQDDAVQLYKSLLVEYVKSTDTSFREASRAMHSDVRYDTVSNGLSREDRERVYTEHRDELKSKRRKAFQALIDENPYITLTSSWEEARDLIQDDPRFERFGHDDAGRLSEFKAYQKDRIETAKTQFRHLLYETKSITHKTLDTIRDPSNPERKNHLKEILQALENDKRYHVLEGLADDRTSILNEYFDELKRRGPPPPPTASKAEERK